MVSSGASLGADSSRGSKLRWAGPIGSPFFVSGRPGEAPQAPHDPSGHLGILRTLSLSSLQGCGLIGMSAGQAARSRRKSAGPPEFQGAAPRRRRTGGRRGRPAVSGGTPLWGVPAFRVRAYARSEICGKTDGPLGIAEGFPMTTGHPSRPAGRPIAEGLFVPRFVAVVSHDLAHYVSRRWKGLADCRDRLSET